MIAKPKILIIEDDPINMLIITEMLKTEFTLFHALSYEVALELIHNIKFNHLIVDYYLGNNEKNGIDILKLLLKTQPECKPNIGISSSIRNDDKTNMIQNGFDYFFQKPLDKSKILSALK